MIFPPFNMFVKRKRPAAGDAPSHRRPEIDAEDFGANTRTVQVLRRYGQDGEVPKFTALDIVDRGAPAIAKARDIVAQMRDFDERRANGLASGILSYLPTDEHRRAFLGGAPHKPLPFGVKSIAPDNLAGTTGDDTLGQAPTQEEKKPQESEPTAGDESEKTQETETPTNDESQKPQEQQTAETPPSNSEGSEQRSEQDTATPPDSTDDETSDLPDSPPDEQSDDEQLAMQQDNEFIAKDPEQFFKNNKGKFLDDGLGGNNGQCVSLVKQAVPGIGQTKDWREGAKITPTNSPPLKPGTAIATFKDGKYQGNRKHAAIFLEYAENNGEKGIKVIDQWSNQPTQKRFIPFAPGAKTQQNAGAYSVITK
ncbi:MAG: BPSL0067 family protein [Alphaproteobacteria bacterium]